jgi:hypothetical protein
MPHGNTSLAPIVHQKNCILVTKDNMYMVNQKMKVYFVDFVFIQNSSSFAINVTCDLSNTSIYVLVANVWSFQG